MNGSLSTFSPVRAVNNVTLESIHISLQKCGVPQIFIEWHQNHQIVVAYVDDVVLLIAGKYIQTTSDVLQGALVKLQTSLQWASRY